MNGRQYGLPQLLGKTLIRRVGNKILVENTEGLRVRCSFGASSPDSICSVTVSGWYFGKTGGLLGVYDNEPSNDFMTPMREVVEDEDVFAESWTVGSCSAPEEAPVVWKKKSNVVEEVHMRKEIM